ncbi:hypothetical protein RchiOBHm_Chr7g0187551 [Rosa chinensis]|uniref:Lipoprotein n=1 Tax=Rosa chinensis TaxID=74649 RepID=A0A2P6P4A9_ROSCH|nr:hypothetical protein RchiOBHm_Chr7g0187551 [Rosa chinensis]
MKKDRLYFIHFPIDLFLFFSILGCSLWLGCYCWLIVIDKTTEIFEDFPTSMRYVPCMRSKV